MRSKHTQLIVAIIVLILVGIGYVLYAQNRDKKADELSSGSTNSKTSEETTSENTDSATAQQTEEQPQSTPEQPKETRGVFSDEFDVGGAVDTQVFEVVFDGSAFLPNTLEIRKGDIVVFKNQSSTSFWPASDPHPSSKNYPEFDASGSIAASKSFDFKFTKVGSWGFHDHLNPDITGTIVVTN